MAHNAVIILSGHSLFAEGTASSLRQKSQELEITVIDPRDGDVLSRIQELEPAAIILDKSDQSLQENCPVEVLLKAVPDLRIIRLDPENERIQIVTGEERPAANAADLLVVISSAG